MPRFPCSPTPVLPAFDPARLRALPHRVLIEADPLSALAAVR